MSVDNACYGCENRYPACWGSCTKYAEEKARRDENRKARQRELVNDKNIRDVQYHGLKRHK